MDFEAKTLDQGVVVTVNVDLDLLQSKEFEKIVLAAVDLGKPRLVIDFTKTNFIDSSGIQGLVVGMKKMKERGGKMNLVITNPQIIRIFTMVSLHRVFGIFPTLDEALK